MSTDVTSVTKSLDRIADALEGGSSSGGSVFIIHITEDSDGERSIMDKTWKEIKDAFILGIPCIVDQTQGDYFLYSYIDHVSGSTGNGYGVDIAHGGSYNATSENDYPYMGW